MGMLRVLSTAVLACICIHRTIRTGNDVLRETSSVSCEELVGAGVTYIRERRADAIQEAASEVCHGRFLEAPECFETVTHALAVVEEWLEAIDPVVLCHASQTRNA